MNDPIPLLDFLKTVSEPSEKTTVFPSCWTFCAEGNILLKRKRKHRSVITKEIKLMDWFVFTCSVWGVKFNRERKNLFIKELMEGADMRKVEQKIKQKKNDDLVA